MQYTISASIWPIRGEFRLSRGSRTEVKTLTLTFMAKGATGRGEAVPYARYGESFEGVAAAIESVAHRFIEFGRGVEVDTALLQTLLPAGAARNACDLALWDWWAKYLKQPVWELAGLPEPQAVQTAYTLSLADADVMARAAAGAADYPLLKLKLGTTEDEVRLRAVRAARRDARLIVDANEGWSIDDLLRMAPIMAECGVVLCEQPLAAGHDGALEGQQFPFVICADESVHGAGDIPALAGRYQAVNIKLDKTGGLTEAIRAVNAAKSQKMGVMVGCMLASSLALAPAVLLAQMADWVDLDGPLLLAADQPMGLEYRAATLLPPQRSLWG